MKVTAKKELWSFSPEKMQINVIDTLKSQNRHISSTWYKKNQTSIVLPNCHGLVLGQSFVSFGCGRRPLQDEDHSVSRPLSFPGLYTMRSGRPPEWFRSGPVVAGSWENCRDVLVRRVCGFLFCWTLLTTFLWPFPQFPQKLELCNLPAIWEHLSFVPGCA